MKPVDKFGRSIYGRTWERLVEIGDHLVDAGYTEHEAKPNLFARRVVDPAGAYYADMRGTRLVPVWSDPHPLFYALFRPPPPPWLQRRLWSNEVRRLTSGYDVEIRLSFEQTEEPGGLFFEEGDGYCARCGSDFGAEGLFCRTCLPIVEAGRRVTESTRKAARMVDCAACGVGIDPRGQLYIRHHVSYFPPNTVIVHLACHAAIHLQGRHPHLAPPKGDAARFYGSSSGEAQDDVSGQAGAQTG